MPELTIDGGPRIRAGLGDPGFSDLHPPAFCNPLAPPGERYTAFTGALLGLLNKGIPDGPELLTFAQIYPRLQYTLTSRQLPRPRQQGSDTIAHLALTRNLAYTGQGGTRVFSERFTAIPTIRTLARKLTRPNGPLTGRTGKCVTPSSRSSTRTSKLTRRCPGMLELRLYGCCL